jgi:hypothetical protein
VTHSSGVVSRQQEASDLGPFNALVVADYDSSASPGHFISTAAQASSIFADRITAAGLIEITNRFEVTELVLVEAESLFSLVFDVAEPLDFVLGGSFTGQWDTGGINIDSGSFELNFDGPAGTLFSTNGSTPGPEPGGFIDIPFVAAGVLLPGQYTLNFAFADTLLAVGSPGDPGFGGGGFAAYTMDLLIVPEPSTALLLAGSFFWIARKPVNPKDRRRSSRPGGYA